MGVRGDGPRWLRPLLGVALLGAAVPATVTGSLLMADVRPANFCREDFKIPIDRAIQDARLRRFHAKESFAVATAVAIALAFGGSVGLEFRKRAPRVAVFAMAALALVGYLAADLSGKKEAWHVLSPGIAGWAKVPLQALTGQPPDLGQVGLTFTHPECEPKVAPLLRRRVAQVYWFHVVAGLVMAAAALAIGGVGFGWKPKPP